MSDSESFCQAGGKKGFEHIKYSDKSNFVKQIKFQIRAKGT